MVAVLHMEPSERLAMFNRIKARYDALDREGLRHGKLPMHSTEFGFWGTTNLNDAYDFFSRIHLERFKRFVDLGCGDGRVVAVASLFTDAVGIEGNRELVAVGTRVFEELELVQQGERSIERTRGDHERIEYKRKGQAPSVFLSHHAHLKCKNYYDEDFSKYDIIFMFPDKRYDEQMVAKLKNEFKGFLFIYNRVHAPPGIAPGKTYWIDQMPIASFPLNVHDKNLELENPLDKRP